jgi:multidrug resistance efflux pump
MKPIPTPTPERWRQTRMRALPVLVMIGALVMLASLWPARMGVVSGDVQRGGQVVPVSSYKAGVLASVTVTRFQKVRQGDPLGYVMTADPKALETTVAAVRAEIAELRQNVETTNVPSQQSPVIEEVRARLNWLWQRAELATARVSLQLAETELQRLDELLPEEGTTLRELELARTHQKELQRQVEELAAQVAAGAATLVSGAALDAPTSAGTVMGKMITPISDPEIRLRQVEEDLSPMLLRAPIDGIITDINFRSGEVVTPGSPIILIEAAAPTPAVS